MSGERLVVTSGCGAGRTITVGEKSLLGRGAEGVQDLRDDTKLSRRHALVTRSSDGSLTIEDLGSANGTFVNGTRIDGPVRLTGGDVIKVGSSTIKVESDRAKLRLSPPTAAYTSPQPTEQAGSPSAIFLIEGHPQEPHGACLLYRGCSLPVSLGETTIGRSSRNTVVIDSERVSREHAKVVAQEGRYFIVDLGSQNGTYLNGEQLLSAARWLNSGDTITIGGELIRFIVTSDDHEPLHLAGSIRTVVATNRRMKLGRDPRNDVPLDAPSISRFHAEAVPIDSGYEIRDLGSQNGTRVNGMPVRKAFIRAGDEIGIGPFRLVFDGTNFVQRDERGALRLDAFAASIDIGSKVLLNRASLSIEPGEFVALIGESGAGKSTLLKAISGVLPVSSGFVTINGEPVSTRLADIGYLPQDEIVHPHLTVSESLHYSAKLRLPPDASDDDIDDAVRRVLADVSLNEHKKTRIGSLSGGQRKRAGLATELLNSPGLLFLDEPTTGLDPGLETRMMELFGRLAEVGRQAIVVATHATKNLDLVDKLCVIGRGGEICFVGSPGGAQEFFGVSSYDGIYEALEKRRSSDWRAEFDSRTEQTIQPPSYEHETSAEALSRKRQAPFVTQTTVLVRRYFRVFTRDVRNLVILLTQAPLLAIAIAFLFKPDIFQGQGDGSASPASQLLFLLVTVTIWLGTIDSARELVKERAIFARERSAGVRVSAYLASKALLLFCLCAAQAITLTTVVLILRPLNGQPHVRFALLAELVVTGFVAVAMGLLISSASRSQDQATALIPISMVAQLLFGGAIVTIKNMGVVMATVASVVFSRWSFAGVGTTAGMNNRIANDRLFAKSNSYGHTFFSTPVAATLAILAVFLIVFLAGSVFLLSRRQE